MQVGQWNQQRNKKREFVLNTHTLCRISTLFSLTYRFLHFKYTFVVYRCKMIVRCSNISRPQYSAKASLKEIRTSPLKSVVKTVKSLSETSQAKTYNRSIDKVLTTVTIVRSQEEPELRQSEPVE